MEPLFCRSCPRASISKPLCCGPGRPAVCRQSGVDIKCGALCVPGAALAGDTSQTLLDRRRRRRNCGRHDGGKRLSGGAGDASIACCGAGARSSSRPVSGAHLHAQYPGGEGRRARRRRRDATRCGRRHHYRSGLGAGGEGLPSLPPCLPWPWHKTLSARSFSTATACGGRLLGRRRCPARRVRRGFASGPSSACSDTSVGAAYSMAMGRPTCS